MAIFNIQVNKRNDLNIGNLNLYYNTQNTVPSNESEVLELNNKLIDSTLIEIDILNTSNKHIIAIPENIVLLNIIDIGNSYEEYNTDFNNIDTISMNTSEGIVDYNIYLLETARSFYNNTIFSIFLNTV